MTSTDAARSRRGTPLRPVVLALVVVAAAVLGTLAVHSPALSAPSPGDVLDRDGAGRITQADGALPDGVTVFDDAYPGVAGLDPDLLRAVREAARDAAQDGIGFTVTSGWRSREYQRQLLRQAVSEYGSAEEAARWVASAQTSAHVAGEAVDLGPSEATHWLTEHGAAYGLCQIYRNEPWHYELRVKATDCGCPAMYDDPTKDPRMRNEPA